MVKKSTVLIAAVISGLFTFFINLFFADMFGTFFALNFLPNIGNTLFIALDSFIITGALFLVVGLLLGESNRDLKMPTVQLFFALAVGLIFTLVSVVINSGIVFLVSTFFVRFGLTFFAVMIANNITGGR